MASFDFGIRIKATDGASSVLAGIQQKLSGVGASISGAAERMAKFGFIAGGISAASSSINSFSNGFVELDTATAKIRTLGGDAKALAPQFREVALSMATTMPLTAESIQAATYDALSAGIEPSKAAIESFMDAAGKLAVGGSETIGNSVNVLSSMLNSYGASAIEATKYSDILFTTVNLGKTSIPELSSYLSQVVPTAAAAGVSLDNVGASLSVMTANGVPTAQSTTKLNQLLLELQKPGKDLQPILEAAGVSLESLKNESLPENLARVRNAMEKAGKTAATAFSSSEAGAAFNVLTKDIAKFRGTFDSFKSSAGTTEAAYQDMAQSIDIQTKQLEARIGVLKIRALDSLGSFGVIAVSASRQFSSLAPEITALAGIKSLLPEGAFASLKTGLASALSGVGGIATSAFSSVQSAFGRMVAGLRGFSFSGMFSSIASSAYSAVSGMSSALHSGVASLRAFAAQQLAAARSSALFSGGIGGFAKTIGGSLVGGVRSVLSSVMAMNMAFLTSPVTWIAVALAGAAFLIYKNWAPIKEFFSGLFDGIGKFFDGFMGGIGAAFAAPWSILQEVFAAFSPIIDAVKALFTPVEAVAGAAGKTANQFAWLKDAGVVAGQYLGTALRVLVTPILWLAKVVGQVIGLMTGLSTTGGNMARVLVGAFTAITLPIQIVMTAVGGLFTFIQSLFSGASLQEAGMNMITSLWEGIQATWGKLVEGVKGLVNGITNLFSGKKDEAQAKVSAAAVSKTSADAAKTASAAVQKAVPKQIKAPKVEKPKVPKPDQPKLMPLRPPLAPDFSWIAKQNIEPPKFKPMEPPKLATDTGNAAKTINEELKSISVEGTDLFSANSTAFKLPETPLETGAFRRIDFENMPAPAITLPPFEQPKFSLPTFNIPNVSFPPLPNLPQSAPSPPLPPQIGVPAASGGIVVNFNVNINADGAGGSGASSAQDIANEVEQALRKMAPDIARQIEEANRQLKRLSFAGF
jgi:TP901 family phage tail tape measure protein